MIPAWVAPYIGLSYRCKGRGPDAWDCWGGVRMVLEDVFGLTLPDYTDSYAYSEDQHSVSIAIEQGLADSWVRVEIPTAGDLVIINIAGRPWHCGLIVATGIFLHWPPKSGRSGQQLSSVERLDSPIWAKRIAGFHRHYSNAAKPS